MKKKVFFVSVFAVLLAVVGVTFLSFNKTIPSYAESSSTYTVTFVAPDNSVLYTVEGVPDGVSLQELNDSNLLSNSYFYGITAGTYVNALTYNTFDLGGNWLLQSNTSGASNVIIQSNGSGISVQRVGTQGYTYLDTPIDVLENTTYYYNFSVDGVVYSGIYNMGVYPSSYTAFTIMPYNSTVGFFLRFEFNFSNGNFVGTDFNIGTSNSVLTDFSLDYIYVGLQNYPCFDFAFIKSKLATYDFSNYYYQYDFDFSKPITSDTFVYPVQLTKQSDTWLTKIWTGLTDFSGGDIWTDGSNYYLSRGYNQFVLDESTSTWVLKTWNGFTNIFGSNVWTDGINYYYSGGTNQYVLDSSTSTWSVKTWTGLTNFNGSNVWTDGSNYYYSGGADQYVLDLSNSTWSFKTWNGFTNIFGGDIWTDGINYYYSGYNDQYVLDSLTLTWSLKTWNGLINFYGGRIWSTSLGVYYSYSNQQYVLSSSLTPVDVTYYYNQGYSTGYNQGYNSGYNIGYEIGVDNAGNYTFFSMISAVMDAPLKVFYGLFNFELMGVNLAGFITALFTLAIVIIVIRFATLK